MRGIFAVFGMALLFLLAVTGLQPARAANMDENSPTVLITGSSRGIGLAIVKYYVEPGTITNTDGKTIPW
jgi:hypothetical protein